MVSLAQLVGLSFSMKPSRQRIELPLKRETSHEFLGA